MSLIGNLVGSSIGGALRRPRSGSVSTSNAPALDALTYDPVTFATLDVKTGIGVLDNARTSTRLAQDHEGLYYSVPALEKALHGVRYVENLALQSETYTSSKWAKPISPVTIVTGIDDPFGTTRASRLTPSTTNGVVRQYSLVPEGHTVITSCWLRRVSGTGNVDIYIGTGTTRTNISSLLTTSWKRFAVTGIASAGVDSNGFNIATGGDVVDVAFFQCEDATGRADTVAPSEYQKTGSTNTASTVYWNENGNSVASNVVTEADGALISPLPWYDYTPASTNSQIKSNDLVDVEWTAINVTVGDQDAVGVSGAPLTACTLTASAGNGTVIANAITAASGNHATKWYLQRSVGTGVVELTVDGGSTWQSITASLDADFAPGIVVDQAAVTNPQIGIRIVTSGDAVIVGNAECHLDSSIAKLRNAAPIITTTVAVTVAADELSLDILNQDNSEGAIYFLWSPGYATSEVSGDEEMVSPGAAAGLAYYDGTAGNIESTDGTNTAVKAETVVADTTYKIGIRYSASDSEMRVCIDGVWGTADTYDGAYTLGAVLSLFRSAAYPARMRGLQRWALIGATAQEAQIDEVMA